MTNPGQEPGPPPETYPTGGPPEAPLRGRGLASLVDRRMIIIGLPVLAGLAAVGAVTGYALAGDPPAGGADDGGGSGPGGDGGRLGEAPPVTGTPKPYPTQEMLLRLDQGKDRAAIGVTVPGSGKRTELVTGGYNALPQWSHDRQRIVYIHREADGWQILTIRPDGSQRQVAVNRITRGTRVCWSRDDKMIAYMDRVAGRSQLFTFTFGEARPRQITHSPAGKDDPAWAPDTDGLVAMWIVNQGTPQIALVQLDEPDKAPTWLTRDDAGCADPCWSPDGNWIAYTRQGRSSAQSDIWVVRPDGKDNRAVTSGPTQDMDPTWSPDSQWIAFTRGKVEEPSVWIARPDGKDAQRLTTDNTYEAHASWS